MNLLGGGAPAERILPAQVEESPARDIETITREILDAKRTGGEAILTIGRGLLEAKALLSHGEWLPWLEERVEFSERTARNFMRLAREWTNRQTLADLGAAKALALLALPPEEREAFMAETHTVDGEEKAVIDMSARELQTALKERDEALKAAAQAKADQSAAEQSMEKMAQDMAVANERIAGLSAEVEQRTAEIRERVAEAARLEKDLEKLRARPVEVAVQADEKAVAAARKEAEEAMQAKLDRAKKAQAKAEAAKNQAMEELTKTNAKLQEAQAEVQAIREQMAKTEKKAALAASEDLMLFRTIFDQAQEQVNKLGGVLMKVRNKDPEKAQGLERAMIALSDKIKGVAQG